MGKKTYDQIIKEIAKKANLSIEDTKIGVKPIFDELTKLKFIKWLE
jgi:hypothetical protein